SRVRCGRWASSGGEALFSRLSVLGEQVVDGLAQVLALGDARLAGELTEALDLGLRDQDVGGDDVRRALLLDGRGGCDFAGDLLHDSPFLGPASGLQRQRATGRYGAVAIGIVGRDDGPSRKRSVFEASPGSAPDG